MIINRFKMCFYKFFKPKEIADLEFVKLGYVLYVEYPNKVIYKKTEIITGTTHYINIRFNMANEIHIEAYTDDMMSYRISMDEIDAAMIKVHELIQRRKEDNAKYDTRTR